MERRKGSRRWIGKSILSLCLTLALFWWWQPWEFDFIQKPVPSQTRVSLDEVGLLSSSARVLLITGHPDDAEFYLAGTLLRLKSAGAKVELVVCTDGDKSYYWWSDPEGNRRVRKAEQTRAMNAWGGQKVTFLGFFDGRLRDDEPVIRAVQREIERVRPTHLLLFDSEYPPRLSHADHRRAGDAALEAATRSHLPMWLMRFSTRAANCYVDTSGLWDERMRLVYIHESQFKHAYRIDRLIRSNSERDGKQAGVALAEGFRVSKTE
ncbi:MAG: PIG-L family deacetylase [Armatimonadetes bacterium]|nr:PIG-L family deacetylase [Armatimonadota bacterium]